MSCSNQGVGCCSHSKPCSICTPGSPCDPCGARPPCNAYNPYSACGACGPCSPSKPCNPCGNRGPCNASEPCAASRPCGRPRTVCDPCAPPCCVAEPRQRMERLFDPKRVPYYPCSVTACQYFGSHDTNPPPGAAYLSSRPFERNPNLNSLGIPVGLVKSSFTFRTVEAKGTDFQTQRFATYLKAFAMIYLTPEIDWDTSAIDALLNEGQQLYTASMAPPPDGEEPPQITSSPIYADKELKVVREFDLKGYKFGVELSEKYLPNAILAGLQRNGDEPLPDINIGMLRPAMKGFFRKAKFCLVGIANWYMLVWKARGVYFVFDFFGRRLTDFNSDREQGVAVLLCLKTLDNVLHLIRKLSDVTDTDPIQLREMKVVRLTTPDGRTMNRDFGRRSNQYAVISPEYAYLTSALHLSLKQTDPLRSRSALPVAVAAMLASKIDHPATWTRAVVDKIICYGVNVCYCCWEQCLHSTEPIEIDRFPNRLRMGQFGVQFTLSPRLYEGIWKCVPNYIKSDLLLALEQCFANGHHNLVIQIEHQMYAVWKKNNYIYLLDPYRHRIIGALVHSDLSTKSATVRMFRSLDTFMAVFTQMLLEHTQTTPFQIHTLTVDRIVDLEKPEAAAVRDGGRDDVLSLNETICFEEDGARCKDLLGEISEEDEEEVPIVEEKEPKSESDESEHLGEEEGGEEDLGEYEDSSSGGGHHRRGRRRGRKGKGDSTKGKRGRSKTKGAEKKKRGKSKEDSEKKGKKGKKGDDDEGGKKKRKKSKSTDRDDSKNSKKKGKTDSEDDAKKRKKSKEPKEPKEPKEKAEKPKPPPKEPPKKDDKKKDDTKKDEPPKKDQTKKDDTPPKKDETRKTDPAKPTPPKEDPNRGTSSSTPRPTNQRGSKDATRGTTPGGGKSTGDRAGGGHPSRATDDNDDDDDASRAGKCNANKYPGYTPVARDMAVVGSESGTYDSICKLLRAGFKCADRILTMTPWGNYVVFRGYTMFARNYFVFDGCTCNVNRFRHLDLSCGTAGLLCFANLHDVITYMLDTQKMRNCLKKGTRNIVDDICRKYAC